MPYFQMPRFALSPATALLTTVVLFSSSAGYALAHPRRASGTQATVRHASAHGHHAALRHETVRHEAVRSMNAERATAIQTALIEKGYLTGEPTGSWDAASVAAMQKMQGENGWQTKITPDSRALIKLGLGPQQQDTASLQQPRD